MAKAADAFRTISEVAEWLDTPAHVLRFWESKFAQIKPVKRAGGRRYYRPEDMALLAGIKTVLHEQGMTIKGAQKMLREKGVKHVAGLSELARSLGLEDDRSPEQTSAAPEVKSATAPRPAPPATATEHRPAPPAAAREAPPSVPEAENVVPFVTTMPPATVVAAQAPREAPRPISEEAAPARDDAMAGDHPALPDDPPMAARARIFDALRDARPEQLRARAARIAPLLLRLQDLRARMQ